MKTKVDLLEELQTLTIQQLIDTIKSGDATAATLGVARQLLNDHKVDLLMRDQGNSPASQLVKVLPFEPELEGPFAANDE